jgi:hypothetical protein
VVSEIQCVVWYMGTMYFGGTYCVHIEVGTLKMEAGGFSIAFIPLYPTVRHHVPETHDHDNHTDSKMLPAHKEAPSRNDIIKI